MLAFFIKGKEKLGDYFLIQEGYESRVYWNG